MRGYGRDYDDRNWLDRAEDTVRGWFGGGRDYDRDYGWSGGDRDLQNRGDWSRGPDRAHPGEGYRTNNWNNQHANWDTVDRAGSYYGMDYDRQGPDRQVYRAGGSGYDRDFGRDWDRDRMQGGTSRGMGGGSMGGRGMTGGSMGGGWMGGRGTSGGGTQDRGMRGGQRESWPGSDYGGGYAGGSGWGDYNRGGYGVGDRFRNSTAGGVQPGRYFRGYGNGSTGGSGYEPY